MLQLKLRSSSRSYLAKHQNSVVPHPPYCPELPQQNFTSFQILKPLRNEVVSKPKRRFRKMPEVYCAPSKKVGSRKRYDNGRNFGNGVSPVDEITLKWTVLK